MQDLTFGEQVKIILSRKDMTIKELAKKIEGRTGKKMSRQNLTQRLGRDNFQERDMRMIAEILGCPFYLNILDDSIPAEKTEDEADTIQRTENVPAAGREPAENGEAAQPREQADTPADGPAADKPAADEPAVSGTKADTGAGNVSDEPEGDAADQNESGGMANERDITIGELVDIHKKLDVLESAVKGSGLDEGGAVPDAQQSGEHPGDQPAETPAASGTGIGQEHPGNREYPGDRADQEQPEYPGGQPGGNRAEYPADQVGGNHAGYPGDQPGGNQAGYPGGQPGGNHAEYPGDQPGGNQAEYQEFREEYAGEMTEEPVEQLLAEIESLEIPPKKEEKQEERPHGWRAYFKQRFKKLGKETAVVREESYRTDRQTASKEQEYPAAGYGAADQGEPAADVYGAAYQEEYPVNRGPGYEAAYGEEYPAGEDDNGGYGYAEAEGMEYPDYGYEYGEEPGELQQEEDTVPGELNPYTGQEYESNSVRMHPSRIGYVQVYDRENHQWTDMTEWAFLGYQERKKQLLGKDYDPPIYLD